MGIKSLILDGKNVNIFTLLFLFDNYNYFQHSSFHILINGYEYGYDYIKYIIYLRLFRIVNCNDYFNISFEHNPNPNNYKFKDPNLIAIQLFINNCIAITNNNIIIDKLEDKEIISNKLLYANYLQISKKMIKDVHFLKLILPKYNIFKNLYLLESYKYRYYFNNQNHIITNNLKLNIKPVYYTLNSLGQLKNYSGPCPICGNETYSTDPYKNTIKCNLCKTKLMNINQNIKNFTDRFEIINEIIS